MFPCEEEIMETLTVASTTVQKEEGISQEEPVFQPNQSLAVIWDEGGGGGGGQKMVYWVLH